MTLFGDLRFAARTWRKRPLPMAAAVLTLALGTGANTAIFSVIHRVVLRPLPYPQPERLVQIWSADVDTRGQLDPAGKRLTTSSVVERWRQRETAFERIACYRGWNLSVAAATGQPERLYAAVVSADFFATLGVSPAMGRVFSAEEVTPGHDNVIILSDSLWHRLFQASPSALGATVMVDGVGRSVIGIMPPGVRILAASTREDPDLYAPISTISRGPFPATSVAVIGRIKPGIALAAAQGGLDSLTRKLPDEGRRRGPLRGVRLVPLREEVASGIRPTLLILFASTGCVLLIACANSANLTLAHVAARQKELVVRSALGASRARIVRQVLTESVALSAAGGAAGLLLSVWLTRALTGLYPGRLPRMDLLTASPAVFLFSLGLALATGLAAGIFPAWHFSRGNLGEGLKGAGALSHRSRRGAAFRGALVGAQVAATFVLLISTGLLLRSFLLLRAVDPGTRPERLLTAQVVLPAKTYGTKELQAAFAERFAGRLNALPGVDSAAITNSLPLAGNFLLTVDFDIDGAAERETFCRAITPGYFRAMGIAMPAGRAFEPADSARGGATIVNQAFARRFFPNQDPVGRTLRFGPRESATIVGVAADVRNKALDAKAEEEIYLPFAQMPSSYLDIAVRARAAPAPLISMVRAELRAMDPQQPLSRVLTMEQILDGEVAPRRFQATLLGSLASIALLLAMVGIYGVVAYSVSLRTREIGIRMALGAQPAGVQRLVLSGGMWPVMAGIAAAIPAALAATRALGSWLYGVHAADPATYAAVAALMLAITLAASYIPARRASTIDPLAALHDE